MPFFKRLAEVYDVTFIVFCRDIYDHTVSGWKHTIKTKEHNRGLTTQVMKQIEIRALILRIMFPSSTQVLA